MSKKLHHIGIAVSNLDAALRTCETALGLEVKRIEEVVDQKTRVAFLPVGESSLELLEPTGEDSTVAKFIARRGAGIHHICMLVDDLAAELKRLKDAGLRLIDEVPRPGAERSLVAFVHPSSTGGVLIELAQRESPATRSGPE